MLKYVAYLNGYTGTPHAQFHCVFYLQHSVVLTFIIKVLHIFNFFFINHMDKVTETVKSVPSESVGFFKYVF